MQKSILALLGLALFLTGCANRNEVSYEVPASTGTHTGVNPDPGTSASAAGKLAPIGH